MAKRQKRMARGKRHSATKESRRRASPLKMWRGSLTKLRAAMLEEGSQPGWRREDSHMKKEFAAKAEKGSELQDPHRSKEFSAKKDEGSGNVREDDSRCGTERVQGRIRARLADLCEGCTVGDLGCLLATDVLHMPEPTSQACRPGSTTRKYDIFHFQSPGRCLPGFSDHPFLQVLVGCLNSLHSCGAAGRGDVVSPSARGVLKRLETGAWFTYTCRKTS